MSVGYGVAPAWGGDPLIPTPTVPASEVGDPLPVSIDFSDEPDGPLDPLVWQQFVMGTAAGVVTGAVEPNPATYFQVLGGLGWWKYLRDPPAPADPFAERGYVASPGNILEGGSARVSSFFLAPPDLVDPDQDAFTFEAIVALRAVEDVSDWVGARARAEWSRTSGWTTPLALEIVRAQGAPPVVLASAVLDPELDPVDIWTAGAGGLAELEAELRGDDLTAWVSGRAQVSAQVTVPPRSKLAFWFKVLRTQGATVTSVPAVVGMQVMALRDLERLGPAPAIEGIIEAPQISTFHLPLREWLTLGWLKRRGARQFEALADFDAEIQEQRIAVRVGDVLLAAEPYVGQEFTKTVRDLAAHRGRGGRGNE